MSSKTLDQIVNHLEFLGYKIETQDVQKKEDKQLFVARHSTHNNMIFMETTPNFIGFQTTLTCEKKQSSEMIDYINKFNSISNIAKTYSAVEDEAALIRFEAYYVGAYQKDVFAQFYDLLEDDQKKFYRLENFKEIFL